MATLIFLIFSFVLLIAFWIMRQYEISRETRFFAPYRDRLDYVVDRITFIIDHVDFAAFAREEARRIITATSHAMVHVSLQIVRALERLLTRVIKYLRTRHAGHLTPRIHTREFVRTLTDFKGHLQATRPEIPDIL